MPKLMNTVHYSKGSQPMGWGLVLVCGVLETGTLRCEQEGSPHPGGSRSSLKLSDCCVRGARGKETDFSPPFGGPCGTPSPLPLTMLLAHNHHHHYQWQSMGEKIPCNRSLKPKRTVMLQYPETLCDNNTMQFVKD